MNRTGDKDRSAKVRKDLPVIYRKNVTQARAYDRLSEGQKLLLEVAQEAAQPTPEGFTTFCTKLCGMRVHPGQVDVVRKMVEKDYGVLAAANGWGKTAAYGLIVLWASFGNIWAPPFTPQYKVAVMGPEMKQALLTHSEIEAIRNDRHPGQVWCNHPMPCEFGARCPEAVKHHFLLKDKLIPYLTRDHHLAFTWKHNNALINFESADKKAQAIEGRAFNLIIYDEARLELWLKFIVDEVMLARGVRTENMKILLGSTPLADNFEFMEYYQKGVRDEPDWWARTGSIEENIFLSHNQVEKIRRNLDERVRDQVLSGKFVEPPTAYFVKERVEGCFDNAPELEEYSSFDKKAQPQRTYVGGLDLAVSETGDYSVLTVWDATEAPHRVVLEKVFTRGTSASNVVNYCDIIIQEFNCQIGFDASGPLGVEFQHQVSHSLGWYVPITFSSRLGGASAQKPTILANFRHFVNNKLWTTPNLTGLKAQLLAYSIEKDHRLRKDRLMAQVYAAWIAKDYLSAELYEGLVLDVDSTTYDGEYADPFSNFADDGKSEMQKRYLRLVKETELREEQLKNA